MERSQQLTRVAQAILPPLSFTAVFGCALLLAYLFGVEKKSWWQLSWEFVTGGAVGVAAGAFFFFWFGAVGLVSGALFGALSLAGLVASGFVGGLGLGAVVHLLRHPERYNFNVTLIASILMAGLALAWLTSSRVSSRVRRAVPQHVA